LTIEPTGEHPVTDREGETVPDLAITEAALAELQNALKASSDTLANMD
jgi:hypothetical protein